MKMLLKKIGRFFVILTHEEESLFRRPVLIVDNGYVHEGHLRSTIEEVKKKIPGTDIHVLALERRGEFLRQNFPELKVIHPDRNTKIKIYPLAIQMCRLKKENYNFVIITTLDISTIIAALLFLNIGTHLLLYNQWKQWYAVRMRNIWEFITAKRGADRVQFNQERNVLIRLLLFIPMLIVNSLLFIYLLIYVILAFLGRICHILKFGFKQRDSL